MSVNMYKIRYILDFISRRGKLPTDQFDQILSASELLTWFGLGECLNLDEQSYIEKELTGMIEAETALERLKQSEQLQ
jgi:hypothetical protein